MCTHRSTTQKSRQPISSKIIEKQGRRARAPSPPQSLSSTLQPSAKFPLEFQFQRNLSDTRIARPRHLTESTRSRQTIREAGDSARRQKLRMIENVKELRPELQAHAFRNRGVLQQRHVPVVEPRPVEPPPRRVALLAQRRIRESRRTKELVARRRLPRIGLLERSRNVWSIDAERNRSAKRSPQQRLIIPFYQRDRQASREPRYSANGPSIRKPLRPSQQIEGQQVRIANDKIIRRVKRRKSATQPRIDGIELLAVSGRVVQRLAIGVAKQCLQTPAGMAVIELQRVIR